MDAWTKEYLKERNKLRDDAIEKALQGCISKGCKRCDGALKKIGKIKFRCEKCNAAFKLAKIPPKPVDPSDPSKWRHTCQECGGISRFVEGRFAYVCGKCGNVFEV